MIDLGYSYRPDGNYLIKCECVNCGEKFETLALSHYRNLCEACDQVRKWEAEEPRP